MHKPLAALTALAASALLLVGCAPAAGDNAQDGVVRIVASTNVYGAIARAIAGPKVEITSIIEKADQDPHDFEANARVQLALSRADIVIENGGGYDDFVDTMLAASGNTSAHVIDAVKLSGYDATASDFNEHVFYDYPTMTTVAKAIAAALDIVEPEQTIGADARATGFEAEMGALVQREQVLTHLVAGAGVIITEPVPLYALTACGFDNLTPPKFSAAIESGDDAAPALLQQVVTSIAGGTAAALVYNEQTGGPQTDTLVAAARDAGTPAIGVTETLPAGQTDYFAWQSAFLDELMKVVVPS